MTSRRPTVPVTTDVMGSRRKHRGCGQTRRLIERVTTASSFAALFCVLLALSASAASAVAVGPRTVLVEEKRELLVFKGRVQVPPHAVRGADPRTDHPPATPSAPRPWNHVAGTTSSTISSYRHHHQRHRNHRRQLRRRGLLGPGSAPPRCASRCDGCAPCRAVHVTVPPGAPITTMEYYPEAWRCKCGNRLYLP